MHLMSKKNFKLIIKFIIRFGFIKGLILSVSYIAGKVDKIKLPSIKYPISLRPNTSDLPTFKQVFLDVQYNIPFDNQTKTIIDGGANIGLFSIQIKNIFPNSKIICVEPDLDNFCQLKKNLNFYSNIFYENTGLWHHDTKLKIHDKYDSGKWGMVVEEDNKEGTVDAISINTLIKKYEIDYIDVLKLDIETSEKKLFSENFKEWLPKVKMIIIEFHDGYEKGCSKSFFKAINSVFEDYSFSARGENVIIINNDLHL
jgi:FkbM family methyltransferase